MDASEAITRIVDALEDMELDVYKRQALDKENAAREAAGQPTKPTKFETDKAKLRRTKIGRAHV